MPVEKIERLNYYQGQYLGALDFQAEQAYHRDMRRRHNLGPHTWGIVAGLELIERPAASGTGVDVFLQPGMAVDGFGREIVVLQPAQLAPSLFDAYANLLHREVYLAYSETLSQTAQDGYQTCTPDQRGRIGENYRFVVGTQPSEHSDILVNGVAVTPPPPPTPDALIIPADESVPYQDLEPEGVTQRWLVRIGSVNWDGVNHVFQSAAAGRLLEKRVYAGLVARDVLAQGDNDPPTLRLRPRTAFTDPDAADFARVEGRLQIEGRVTAEKDVILQGGKLSFEMEGGGDDNVPLWMQRLPGPGGTGTDLRIHIGDQAKPDTRLSIGTAEGAAPKDVLAVRGDDVVEIKTGTLDFGSQTRQMINLWTTSDGKAQYGIGVQSNTTYFRSHNEFCWFKDGVHNDAQSNPGGGGTLQLRLDDQARLFFGAQVRQMLNLWNANYGIGVQNSTFYSRSDSDFCWFRGGVHSDTQDDPGGGALAMRLDGASNLSVSGGLSANGSLSIGGNLHVNGTNNLFKVRTFSLAVKNSGQDSAGSWSVSFIGEFDEVYGGFVVFQGFSLFDNSGNTNFTNYGHVTSTHAIPQHVYVRLLNVNVNGANGIMYCAESDASLETDNTVLFTLVVMGRKA